MDRVALDDLIMDHYGLSVMDFGHWGWELGSRLGRGPIQHTENLLRNLLGFFSNWGGKWKIGKIGKNWKSAKVKNLEKICGKLKFGKKTKIGKKNENQEKMRNWEIENWEKK